MSELSDTVPGWGGCLPPVPTTPWDGARCLLSCCVRMGQHVLPWTVPLH